MLCLYITYICIYICVMFIRFITKWIEFHETTNKYINISKHILIYIRDVYPLGSPELFRRRVHEKYELFMTGRGGTKLALFFSFWERRQLWLHLHMASPGKLYFQFLSNRMEYGRSDNFPFDFSISFRTIGIAGWKGAP